MQKEILQSIHIRLSKVILLRDVFSEQTVTNGIQVRTSHGGRKPIVKPGGYWLFMDMGQEEFEIEIESPIYQRRRIRLKPDEGEEAEEIFLYPSNAYPVRPGHMMLQGTARPGMAIWFHLENGMPEGRLIHDCKRGDQEIAVFMREAAGARRRWYIRDKEQQMGEYLQIQEFSEESSKCVLLRPLKYDYRKKDTVLCRAFECMADVDGRFYLLLGHLEEQKYTLYYSYMEEGTEFCKETEFEVGNRKQIQIMEGKS